MILEIGCGDNPSPRSDCTLDVVDLDTVDVVHDLDDVPLPFDSDEFEGVVAHHVIEHLDDPASVLQDLSRIVESGGFIDIRVPIGLDNKIDPTHDTEWTYSTPEYYSQGGRFDFYYDIPLELVDRDIDVWMPMPFGIVNPLLPAFVWVLDLWDGQDLLSATPWLCGVLTVNYKVIA